MNKLFIIGNLTRDPERRVNQDGKTVTNFTVAVSRRKGEPQYFYVSAWDILGENCAKYLFKGRKVAVVGPVNAYSYSSQDGTPRAKLEVRAEEVEFLSSGNPQNNNNAPKGDADDEGLKYTQVETDDLPF